MRRRWFGVLLAAAWLAVAVGPAAPAALAGEPSGAPSGPVVVVGVLDLRWQDVDPERTPQLEALARQSSLGSMTDQSGEGDTRRAAGWLTLGTGSRAVAHVERLAVPDPAGPQGLARLTPLNRSATFHSRVGALGDALHAAGRTVATAGPGALLGGMTSTGTVDTRADALTTTLPSADVVLVELPQLYGIDRDDPIAVSNALTEIDASIGTIRSGLPDGGSLLVAGVTDGATGGAHMHVAMAQGPQFGPGRLTSPSTGRPGVVQLIDIAPTVLWLENVSVPSAMIGEHWQSVAEPRGDTATQVARFVDLDDRSIAQVATGNRMWWLVGGAALVYAAVTVLLWARRRALPPLALTAFVAALPIASWLVQLTPWWRIGTWALLLISVGIAAVIAVAAAFSPWPRNRRWRLAAVLGGVNAAVIAIDAATGSGLSLDAPFGDNPIIAGRFHGVGNVAFALLATGTLALGAALAAGRIGPRAAGLAGGLGIAAVVVDGYPRLGDDFGGVLALLPAVCVLTLVVSGLRISRRWVLAVVAVTAGTAATFALVDYLRPASQRTHLGRFVQQVLDGTAWNVISRKLDSSLHTFTSGWPRWIALVWLALALCAYLAHRRGELRIGADVDRRAAAGLVAALAVVGFLGAALNDSGLAITAFVLQVGTPLLIPLLEPVGRVNRATAAPGPEGGRLLLHAREE